MMKSSRFLRTPAVVALTLWGASCSSSSMPNGGNGGVGPGTGGASGGTAAGGVVGSGGVTARGTGGTGSGGKAGSGAGGSTNGGGNGGAGSGGAVNGGNSGLGSGGAAGSGGSSTSGAAGNGGSGSGGSGSGGMGSGGSTGSGRGGAAGNSGSGRGGSGSGGTATGATGSGGTATGGSGSGGATGTGGTSGTSPGTTAAGSTGCGKTPTLTSGSKTLGSRSYIIRIPSNYDNSHPYRLIFAFHWVGGTMQDVDGGGSSGAVWSYYGLQAQANDSTIFVAPQGISNGWGNSGGADIKFVDDMITLFEGDLCIDTTRIFALGFSYGGAMSYAIACARAKVFRAVAVYSGGTLSGCDGGKDPIAYLGIHGISDGTLNISGGRSMRDTFVKNNGCTAQSPPEPSAGSGKHICTKYSGCKSEYPVEWCAFDGGHTPGNVDGGGDDGAKTWTKGETWPFFTQF